MVWKAAVVSQNCSVFKALALSFSFGKRHFLPAAFLLMIKGSLSNLANNGNSFNWRSSGNLGSSSSNRDNIISDMPLTEQPFDGSTFNNFFDYSLADIIKILVIVATSLITIIAVVVGLIKMIFDIFFGLLITIIYLDDWDNGYLASQTLSTEEVVS